MARILNTILEVAQHSNERHTARRHQAAILQLRQARIAGFPVVGIICLDDKPVQVPCFQHDVRCQCQHPEPWNVNRYFGVNVVLEGEPGPEILGAYWILPGAALLQVVGLNSSDKGTEELQLIERF